MAYLGKPLGLIEIEKEMMKLYGRRMSQSQVSREIGIKDWNKTTAFLAGLPVLNIDGTKRWKTADVAQRIYESTEE